MKVLLVVISFVAFLPYLCFGVITNFDELEAASDHGHETGLSSKDKRCHEPLHLPLYDRFLGANAPNLLPSVLKRRSPTREAPMLQLASRFRPEESETGLSESQDRYYTVGSFGPGPKQQILAKMLNIAQDVHLERLVVLAKDKSKTKPIRVPHPVVIDTAHVFTRNDGKAVELDLELHDVKGSDNGDLNLLTSQLNKELDAAIETKKNLRGDSHLTPQEIDKIIEHVVDQIKKKKSGISKVSKEMVGSTMDLTKSAESELDGNVDGFKKKRKHKGSKKQGFIDEEDEVVGKKEDAVNFRDDVAEVPTKTDDAGSLDDEALLGTKKVFKFGKFKKSKGYGKKKGGNYRQNNAFENSDEELEAIKNENPLHVDMTEDLGMENLKNLKDIEPLIEGENSNNDDEEMSLVGSKIPIDYSGDNEQKNHEINDHLDDSTLGTKLGGGYGNGNSYSKKKGLFKKMKKPKFGKGKNYYRENDNDHSIEDAPVGSSQAYQNQPMPQFQGNQDGYQPIYQVPNQYAPSGSKQQYTVHQPTYKKTVPEYPPNMPSYHQIEPETYHSNGQTYSAPPSDNQYQTDYYPNQYMAPMSQPVYKQPSYPASVYDQPKLYVPMPTKVQGYQAPKAAPAQPQAAYSSSKNYKSVNAPVDDIDEIPENIDETDMKKVNSPIDILGSSKDLPQDPQLKATFLENEVKRLRQWISDNGPANMVKPGTAIHRQNDESSEKDELVDKFTKVIEHDLTDGKKLTPTEKKNLDKKIAKMVRENLNDQDAEDAKKKSLKKLEKLEEFVEEEDDENVQDIDEKLGSHIDDFKSRFSPKADEESKVADGVAPKKKVDFGNLLKSSLDNRNKEKIIENPKPLNLKNMVGSMPKLADIMKPVNGPKLGLRSGMDDKAKKDSIVGKSNSGENNIKIGKKARFHDNDEDDYEEEYHAEPHYHHHGGYDDYRSSEKKDDVLSNLEKLLHLDNPHGHKKVSMLDGHERSGEEDEPKTLPDIIKQIEENIEEKLHLPPFPTLPAMRQNHNKHHQSPYNPPKNIPQIQVNGDQFIPNNEPISPPLPEMPPRGLPQPEFQSRAFPGPAHRPEHFNMPPNQNIPRFQGFVQQGPQSFVGAPQPQGPARLMPNYDMTNFGKIVPEHLHDLHLRDISDQMKKHRMYFVGDGIKLPLHMHKHEDGTFHLSVDLQKLCAKCNSTDLKNGMYIEEPDFISTNHLGSKHNEGKQSEDDAMNIEDVPLMMPTPNFDGNDDLQNIKDNDHKEEHKKIKRSPRFNYLDNISSESQSNEENDYANPILQAIKEDVEHKIDSFNKDIKEYYNNEADIKNEKLNNGDIRGFLAKRVRLLSNILGLLKEVTFEN